jgi:hypothetical protein
MAMISRSGASRLRAAVGRVGAAWACLGAASVTVFVLAAPVTAQQPPAAGQPPATPGQQTPGAQVPLPRAQGATPTPTATAARTFTGPVGLLFNTVRADKAVDFERLVATVRAALEASTDATVQAQAKGWRFYKASEPGPGNSVLYVFVIDPTVPGEDYGLGRILSMGSTDAAALQETWKLYTGSVTGGGSLLNLSPIPVPPPDPVAPAAGEKPAAPAQKP